MSRRFRDVLLGILIGSLIVGGIFSAGASEEYDLSRIVPFSASDLWLIKQVRTIVETYHVEGSEDVSEKDLLYGAIHGMVKAWNDPYTRFVDPDELEEEEIEMEGEYGGLGIYISQRDGRTTVVSPIEGTPADRVGLKPGDEIVRIGEEVILGWDQKDVVDDLRGKPGTEVTIWVRREGENQLLEFHIRREQIQINTVRHEMIGDTGYLRIMQFNQKTEGEFLKAIRDIESKKARDLVLDLRNNPGGLLNVCVEIADMFLDDGVIVSTRGRFDRANDVLYATPGKATELPMVVLINEGSASASEILAGALKDHEKAVLVGKKTFGKGSVQTLFNLPDSSGIFVTIAKYYTPSGRVIDKIGLEPDIEVEGEFGKERDEDEQLQRALKELRQLR
ncbi:MAG: S41 family peptidase [Thermovirgaceae bacterium]